MNPSRVDRNRLEQLTDLPNIGRSLAQNLQLIGIDRPQQLRGRSPYDLYLDLCGATGVRQDPCVLDVFISITRFIDGEDPRPWWDYTAERKRDFGQLREPGPRG